MLAAGGGWLSSDPDDWGGWWGYFAAPREVVRHASEDVGVLVFLVCCTMLRKWCLAIFQCLSDTDACVRCGDAFVGVFHCVSGWVYCIIFPCHFILSFYLVFIINPQVCGSCRCMCSNGRSTCVPDAARLCIVSQTPGLEQKADFWLGSRGTHCWQALPLPGRSPV